MVFTAPVDHTSSDVLRGNNSFQINYGLFGRQSSGLEREKAQLLFPVYCLFHGVDARPSCHSIQANH